MNRIIDKVETTFLNEERQLVPEMVSSIKIEHTVKGEYVKKSAESKIVFMRLGYCRTNKKYEIVDVNTGQSSYIKKGNIVYIGFTY